MMVGVPVFLVGPASADRVYHSTHYDLTALNAAPLRSGSVENIHANGPTIYAHEQYVLNGAAPNTTYDVVLMIFPGDTTCSGAPAVSIPTATIQTNTAGNGVTCACSPPLTPTAYTARPSAGCGPFPREARPLPDRCATIVLD